MEHRIEPSQDALPPGTPLAEYEILSVLSEGRFGIVYLAMDRGLQRHVAIKEYLPAALACRGRGTVVALRSDRHAETFALGLKSFVNEARLLARFDHPALARVHRFWEGNRTAYMVMPYYDGVTLDATRQSMERPPDEAWLRSLLLPLLDALHVLHHASCYPRDISPENVLLQPDGRPVLLDFGAARHAIGDHTQALTVILKPAFAPIEQYAESPKLRQGPWTNLYSLAAVAYYCVSGHPPMASTARVLDDQMEPLSEVVDRLGRSFPELDYSVAFVSAIERALSVRPEERPQSVAEFRRALLGGQRAAESSAVPPPAEEAQPHRAPPPLRSAREQNAPFHVFLNASHGGNVEHTSREGSGWPPETEPRAEPKRQTAPAWDAHARSVSPPWRAPRGSADDADDADLRAALDAALRPHPDDFRGAPRPAADVRASRDAKADGGRRALLLSVAAVALAVLGAGGWMMWLDYRDANPTLPSMALNPELEGRRAALLTPETPAATLREPPAQTPPPRPSGAAGEPQVPAPAIVAPATEVQTEDTPGSADPGSATTSRPDELPQEAERRLSEGAAGETPAEKGAVAEAPAGVPPPDSPAAGEEAPRSAPGSAAVAAEARSSASGSAAVADEAPSPAPGPDPVAEDGPRTAPESPAASEEAPPPPPQMVKNDPDNPRAVCGPRTHFSLYRCMKRECERPKYYNHPDCRYLRATDEVRVP